MKMEVVQNSEGEWFWSISNDEGPVAQSAGYEKFDQALEDALEEMQLELKDAKIKKYQAREARKQDVLKGLSPRARASLHRRGFAADVATVKEIAAALDAGKFDEFKDRDEIARWIAARTG